MLIGLWEIFWEWPHGTIMVGFIAGYFAIAAGIFSAVILRLAEDGQLAKLMLLSRLGSRVYNGEMNP